MRRIGDDIEVDDGERDDVQIVSLEQVQAQVEARRHNEVLARAWVANERRRAFRRIREAQTLRALATPVVEQPLMRRSFPLLSACFAILVGFLFGVLVLASMGRGIVSMGW